MERDTSSATTSKRDKCNAPCCFDPLELFSAAAAISILLYENLSICQLETVINLLTMVNGNLAGFITQVDINTGVPVEPPF